MRVLCSVVLSASLSFPLSGYCEAMFKDKAGTKCKSKEVAKITDLIPVAATVGPMKDYVTIVATVNGDTYDGFTVHREVIKKIKIQSGTRFCIKTFVDEN